MAKGKSKIPDIEYLILEETQELKVPPKDK